ncbi:MAG TPA: hypothetical protein VGN60_08105 [Devosia sp.]|jgi:hypothetical protein|nr:hypothetical protein [Devosia sp.]
MTRLQEPHEALLLEDGGQVAGWAVKRPCSDGAKIGPLFATDSRIAVRLLECFSGPVTIDVPETQFQFTAVLQRRGFAPGFRTARMYRGPAPGLELGMIYGISSLELG